MREWIGLLVFGMGHLLWTGALAVDAARHPQLPPSLRRAWTFALVGLPWLLLLGLGALLTPVTGAAGWTLSAAILPWLYLRAVKGRIDAWRLRERFAAGWREARAGAGWRWLANGVLFGAAVGTTIRAGRALASAFRDSGSALPRGARLILDDGRLILAAPVSLLAFAAGMHLCYWYVDAALRTSEAVRAQKVYRLLVKAGLLAYALTVVIAARVFLSAA